MQRLGMALVLATLALCGCDRSADDVEFDLQVQQRAEASRAGLTLARAREIVAEVTGVEADSVTIMYRSVDDRLATVLAAVPAAEGMLHEEARRPTPSETVTEQTIEAIDLRWDLDADQPTLVLWGERLQFAPYEPVTAEQAEATARELLNRWVPEEAGEIEPLDTIKLRAPVYVSSWIGTVNGHFTGDRAVVQVSSVTGLPISFSQRIAVQRPSPDEIALSRDQALETVRSYLREEDVADADTVPLVAQLSLSAEGHPTGGAAWLVALIGPQGQQVRVLMVDAMTGEVLPGGREG